MLKDLILSAEDMAREKVPCPEWGVDVWIRALNGTERDQFEESNTALKGSKVSNNFRNIRARLIVLCAVDSDGKQIFLPGDADSLGAKSAKVLDRLFQVACKLSGITKEDVAELEKN